MRAFVVLSLVFSTPSRETGLAKRLRNDLFCVEWDVKPQFNPSTINQVAVVMHSALVSTSAHSTMPTRRVAWVRPSAADEMLAPTTSVRLRFYIY